MDTPTRVGLGGTALFTVAGLSQPLFGWWVSGPVMAICGVVAGWGFWPLLVNRMPSLRKVPLDDAARRAYEAVEKAGVVDLFISPTSAAKDKLYHFKMALLVDERVRLFGEKPPSTRSRLIPKEELHQELYPSASEPNALDYLIPSDHPPAFVNVTVPRTDLRRVIKVYLSEYVDEVKRLRR